MGRHRFGPICGSEGGGQRVGGKGRHRAAVHRRQFRRLDRQRRGSFIEVKPQEKAREEKADFEQQRVKGACFASCVQDSRPYLEEKLEAKAIAEKANSAQSNINGNCVTWTVRGPRAAKC